MRNYIFPFGKYKGRSFEHVPLMYLDWLQDKKWVDEDLKQEIGEYLADPVVARELDIQIGRELDRQIELLDRQVGRKEEERDESD